MIKVKVRGLSSILTQDNSEVSGELLDKDFIMGILREQRVERGIGYEKKVPRPKPFFNLNHVYLNCLYGQLLKI